MSDNGNHTWNARVRVWRTVRGIVAPNLREAQRQALIGAPPRAVVQEIGKAVDGGYTAIVKAVIIVRNIEAADRREAMIKAVDGINGNATVEDAWKQSPTSSAPDAA